MSNTANSLSHVAKYTNERYSNPIKPLRMFTQMYFWHLLADLDKHIYWGNIYIFFKLRKCETYNTQCHSSTAVLLRANNKSNILVWCPTKLEWQCRICLHVVVVVYTLSNKNPSAWYFVHPTQAVTWRTVATIIRVDLLSPYLCIRGGRNPLQDKYCHKSEPQWEYVEWGEKANAGNLACPPSQKQQWAMGPCDRRVGWSCFVSVLHSITDWVHDTTNEIGGRNRMVLDSLLKPSISENSPFKG